MSVRIVSKRRDGTTAGVGTWTVRLACGHEIGGMFDPGYEVSCCPFCERKAGATPTNALPHDDSDLSWVRKVAENVTEPPGQGHDALLGIRAMMLAAKSHATEIRAHRDENAALLAERDEARRWVSDLQSGMYVNCVYCGHRYGPKETTPVSMADALKAHVSTCPKHPMSALLAALRPYARDNCICTGGECRSCVARAALAQAVPTAEGDPR